MRSSSHSQEPRTELAEPGDRPPYDPERRRAAEILEDRHPAWLVMYGSYSRLLWVWSRFATRDGKSILIASRDATELDERMSALELERRSQ